MNSVVSTLGYLGLLLKGPSLNPDTGDSPGCVAGGRGGHSDAVYPPAQGREPALTSSSQRLQEPKQSLSCGRSPVGTKVNNQGNT